MKFSADVPTRVVNLELPPEKRWAEVIAQEIEVARTLLKQGWDDALRGAQEHAGVPPWLLSAIGVLARGPLHAAYRVSGGRYVPEIYAWADALGESRSHVVMMQCMYELSHLDPIKVRPPVGCSAGVAWIEKLGMVHARTLDWNMDTIGPATRVFEFHRGARKHFVVGIPGLVGVLSGMVPGGFSVTINWAPPVSLPFFYLGPLFELRDLLETCDTYEQAKARLSTRRLSTSVFYTLCGVNHGEACVIENVKTKWLGGEKITVREVGDGSIAQSNHYQAGSFAHFNPPLETSKSKLLRSSCQRAAALTSALETSSAATSLDDLAHCLNGEPVENSETRQKMIFCPARGDLRVWREVPETGKSAS